MVIKGTVQYQNLGTGFWGIVGSDGSQWQAVNMPAALQQEGLQVTVKAKEEKGAVSVFMWGRMIKILEYSSD